MHPVNLSTIDIRLLLVFEALMRERSVSRAAQDVGMSQPAVSRALNALRQMLKDELFVRSPGGMMPTAQARDLAPPIREVLARMQAIFESANFVPQASTRTFRLAASDHCAALVLPILEERLRREAPGIKLRVRPRRHLTVAGELDMGEIDLALGIALDLPSRIKKQVLFSEPYVCVMRRGHPLARPRLSYDDYMAAEHLAVTHMGEPLQAVDVHLRKDGVKRRVPITINQALLAPEILLRSDLILTTQLNLVRRLSAFADLHVAPLPIPIEPLSVHLAWHRDLAKHAAHEWLRGTIIDICASLAIGEGEKTTARSRRSGR
ncbi:MAG TPA: LysR family transcriptional regulator [Dongiaceae bacterium]|jgi:DNA-binding transcriptional LysR family regulator|nr:LysR family transcriptional regulator [Dongiaceae bacterium]